MPEIEDKAKAQGWTPKEEFKGNPDNWRTAEQFLEVGKNIQAVQSERNGKLLGDNGKLLTDIEDLKSSMKELTDQQFKVIAEAKTEGYKKAMADLSKKQLKAVEDGDVDEYKALEKEKAQIKKPDVKKPAAPAIDPEFKTWHGDNPWYKANSPDPVSMAADTYGAALMKQRPDLIGAEYYKEVERHIKLVFPDNFKAPASKLDTSDNGTKGGGGSGKETFDNLPPEAKKACKLQVEKFGISQDGYVKQYYKAYGE